MARTKFGQTWWGAYWLNALSNIDYSNRLPRGRSYANSGTVSQIDIKKNWIEALVKGSRPRPYRVSIRIPPFNPLQKIELLQTIIQKPLLLSNLLNGQLPQELVALIEEKKILFFPNSWKDFKMECSCPDWAVPCKHIAAVIYLMANEIDKNPFLLFEMKELKILEELKNLGYTVQDEQDAIPSIHANWLDNAPIPASEEIGIPAKSMERKTLELSSISDLLPTIRMLLDPKPLFFETDFRRNLLDYYAIMQRMAIQFRSEKLEQSDAPEDMESLEPLEFSSPDGVTPDKLIAYRTSGGKRRKSRIAFRNISHAWLDRFKPKELPQLSPLTRLLYYYYHSSLRLIEQAAYIPEITRLPSEKYAIRWIPALFNKEVETLVRELTQQTPPNFLKINSSDGKIHYLPHQEQTLALLSWFIGDWLKSGYSSPLFQSNVEKLFFNQIPMAFDQAGQKQVPLNINQWLSKLFIAHSRYVPLLEIELDENTQPRMHLMAYNKENSLEPPIPLKNIMEDPNYTPLRMDLLKKINPIGSVFAPILELIQNKDKNSRALSDTEIIEFLTQALPLLQNFGIPLLIPNSFRTLIRPKLTMSFSDNANSGNKKSFLSLDQMLQFNWQVALGDTMVSPQEFEQLLKKSGQLLKYKNQFVVLDPKEIALFLKRVNKKSTLTPAHKLQIFLSEEFEGARVDIDPKLRDKIKKLMAPQAIELPGNLNAQLRPYQQRGFEWLYANIRLGFGSIIADDMGLGKTLQVICLLLKLQEEGKLAKHPALVVAPTTLLTNWIKEVEKFTFGLTLILYHGQDRNFPTTGYDAIITSYGIIRRDQEKFNQRQWSALIIDEAQNIKNPTTAQTQAIKGIKANIRVAMSGTPVENRLVEYWSIFDFINQGYLGSRENFTKEFALPIEIDRNEKKLNTFKKITAPFILRRLKTDKSIIDDLPDKIENNQYTTMTPEQTSIYQKAVERFMAMLEGLDDTGKQTNIQRQGIVLQMLSTLKQICNHPALYLKKDSAQIEHSGKTMLLFELLNDIVDVNEKVLIFTQYATMGKLIEKMIREKHGWNTLFLHGAVSRKGRDEQVEVFQNDPTHSIFILSLKAGGTGLNLTAANHVIHYDLWWNPAVENQATDRAFRIGQKRNVIVYRLLTRSTLEERIDEMIQHKKELAQLAVSQGEQWLGKLSTDELRELVKLTPGK